MQEQFSFPTVISAIQGWFFYPILNTENIMVFICTAIPCVSFLIIVSTEIQQPFGHRSRCRLVIQNLHQSCTTPIILTGAGQPLQETGHSSFTCFHLHRRKPNVQSLTSQNRKSKSTCYYIIYVHPSNTQVYIVQCYS